MQIGKTRMNADDLCIAEPCRSQITLRVNNRYYELSEQSAVVRLLSNTVKDIFVGFQQSDYPENPDMNRYFDHG